MRKQRLLMSLVIGLTITFFGFQVFNQEAIADIFRGLILPALVVLYCTVTKEKSSFFFYFLVCYAISEFLGMFGYFALKYTWVDNLRYYGGNIMYITAYMFLILEILRAMNLKVVFNRYAVPFIILIALDIYCVILVSQISYSSDNFIHQLPDLIIEVIYNIVVMLMLTFALINYMSKHSKKAMNMLLGVICFVVSEVVQVGYFYVDDDLRILASVYTLLLILAFLFLYIQARMSYVTKENYNNFKSMSVNFSDKLSTSRAISVSGLLFRIVSQYFDSIYCQAESIF